jgi:DNA-binding YbaB/EbfC family protein
MMNIQKMMKQAQQMQFKLQELQEKFKDVEVSAEAGSGAVQVTMTCAGEVTALTIQQALIAAGDKEMLEDLVIAAVNAAVNAKDERIQAETQKMMADLGLPADTKLPPV